MNSTSRYLVICGNGPASLHVRWMTGQYPLFDVLLAPYGGASAQAPADWRGRVFVHQRTAERNVMPEILASFRHVLASYDYILLIGDDIDVPGGSATIHGLFVTAERDGFDLCQPALLRPDVEHSTGRHGVYDVLFERPGTLYRCVTMIEMMCPIFSRRAWLATMAAWAHQICGTAWGMEGAWASLLGVENGRTRFGGRIAVIDRYPVAHTRPNTPANAQSAADMAAMRSAGYGSMPWPEQTGEVWRMPEVRPVSLTMVVQNEAKRLGRMLSWHRPFVDDIAVVVQASDDDTLAVARSFADVVIEAPSVGYCEAHRALAAEAAAHDWHLCLDADELLTEPFRRWLCGEWNSGEGSGYRLRRQNWRDGARSWPQPGEGPGDAQYRFYRRDAVRFLDEIHTEPQPTGTVWTWGDGRGDALWIPAIYHVKTSAEQRLDEERCHRLLSAGGPLAGDPLAAAKLALNTATGLTSVE